MDSEKDHIIYTAEDIRKYFSGGLKPAEMHAMEKAALEDDFLAEAMEGFGGTTEQDWTKELTTLKNSFVAGTAKVVPIKRVNNYSIWRVAAAVLVIFCGISLTYLLTNRRSAEKSIATVKLSQDSIQKQVATVTAPDSSAVVNGLVDDKSSRLPSALPSISQSPVAKAEDLTQAAKDFVYRPAPVEKVVAKREPGGGYVQDTIKPGAALSTGSNALTANGQPISENNGDKNFAPVQADMLKKATTAVILKKFTAQIVAPDGSPLPFANIRVKQENVGTYADARGNFNLLSTDSILNVEIKSAGYLTRTYGLLSSAPGSKIVLAENELAFREKIQVPDDLAANAKYKGRRAILVPDSVINVEPEDGWSNYNTYITNNLPVSNDILKRKIHGEVEVSFEVQSDGALTNVKVDKSLCDDCDEAALRVVKDGPRWKVKKGSSSSGKVKVKF